MLLCSLERVFFGSFSQAHKKPPHRCFSQALGDDFVYILEKAEPEPIRQIFGLGMFLSYSGSKISVCGYDGKFGFSKVYNVSDYSIRIVLYRGQNSLEMVFVMIMNEPYYTEQCG